MSHILIVDDDRDFCEMLEQMLGREGYQVTCSYDGNEALRKTNQHSYDLVITDIIMPEKEGLELIHTLRRGTEVPRIIAVSGGSRSLSSEGQLRVARLLGADGTLSKPFERDQILEMITKLLAATS